MDRRVFLRAFGGSLLAAPLAAEAQQAGKVYRIGVISSGINPRSASFFQAFEQQLRSHGWVEGTNLAIDYRTPRSSSDFAVSASDLVRENVDVILAGGPDASLKAARQATATIPIVIVALNYDPIEKGYVASLARPGGNVTGVFSRAPEVGAKALELLQTSRRRGPRSISRSPLPTAISCTRSNERWGGIASDSERASPEGIDGPRTGRRCRIVRVPFDDRRPGAGSPPTLRASRHGDTRCDTHRGAYHNVCRVRLADVIETRPASLRTEWRER
jgi:hypothetical protein